MGLQYTDNITAVNAITATGTTTTAGFDVSKRQLRSVQFLSTAFSSGTIIFRVDVSNDGVNWITYQRLTDNLTNTNAQGDTRIAFLTSTTNQSKIYFIPVGDYFRLIRFRVGITTDGTASVILQSSG